MSFIVSLPGFPLFVTLLFYFVFDALNLRLNRNPLANPLLLSGICLIFFLELTGLPVERYQSGVSMLVFFIGPLTVALALPLYKRLDLLKKHSAALACGAAVGVGISLASVLLFSKLFGLDKEFALAALPKAVTMPIGLGISKSLGFSSEITVVAILTAGLTGTVAGPPLLKLLRIKSKLAQGFAMGAASHVLGAARAYSFGETASAAASAAIGVCSLLTVAAMRVLSGIIV